VKGDTEGFVNMPLSIKGIIFSAFFIEKESSLKIIPFKSSFPVNEFALSFLRRRTFERFRRRIQDTLRTLSAISWKYWGEFADSTGMFRHDIRVLISSYYDCNYFCRSGLKRKQSDQAGKKEMAALNRFCAERQGRIVSSWETKSENDRTPSDYGTW